jgi:hypothetical protein
MSLDYPFYKELCRFQHPAAKWWRWGDTLYYIGIIPAVILSFPILWSLIRLSSSSMTPWQVWVLSLFAFFIGIFLLGTRLKLKSWKMAAKDGINVNDYWMLKAVMALVQLSACAGCRKKIRPVFFKTAHAAPIKPDVI